MNGSTFTYWLNGGKPLVTGMKPLSNRTTYASTNAATPRMASDMT